MKKINLTFFLLIFTFAGIFCANGQVDRLNKRTIKVTENNTPVKTDHSLEILAVKINIPMVIFGELPVSAEFAPFEWFTVEAGAGPTFKSILTGGFNAETPPVIENNLGEPRTGISYFFNIKFFEGFGPFDDGAYLGLQYNNRFFFREYKFNNGGNKALVNYVEEYRDYTLIGGAHFLPGAWDSFFLDYYAGIGYRNIIRRSRIAYNDNVPAATNGWDHNGESGALAILVGVKIGYIL